MNETVAYAQRQAEHQRSRLVATVMEMAERELYPHVPAPTQARFRRRVLQAVGQYHDFVLDALKATISDEIENELVVELLEQVAADVATLKALQEA